MAFDYEALAGHLHVVGGRVINAGPPGYLVESAPQRAARGREMDTFFGLVLPGGGRPAPAAFYERMVQVASEDYFESSGSVTAGLRTLLNNLNDNLYRHNLQHETRFDAWMLCAVLHGSDVFLARVGGGAALLQVDDHISPFPAEAEGGFSPPGLPLGAQAEPDIRMTHYSLSSGARLVVGDSNFEELLRVEDDGSMDALDGDDLAQVILGFRRLTRDSLSLMAVEFVPPDAPSGIAAREAISSRREALAPETGEPEEQPAGFAGEQVRRSAGSAALRLADGMDRLGVVIERIAGREGDPEAGRLARLANTGSIVLIPIAVVLLALVMWLGGAGSSEYERCVEEAWQGARLARNISSADVSGTLSGWAAVQTTVERCTAMRPEEIDVALVELRREGQAIVDRINDIERREIFVVEAFPNAILTDIVLRGDDLYVLDSANQQVYRITLNESGLGIVPGSRQPIATMRRGAQVDLFTIDTLVGLTWSEDGSGLSQNNVLLALDEAGVLVEYSPTFLARGVQGLLGTEQWRTPKRVASWRGRMYILDPGAEQIWRYDPLSGAFAGAPIGYFAGANRPLLAQAVDFAIDDSGRVYVLFSDGVIALFRAGEEIRFGYAGFPPGQEMRHADAMFLNTDPVAPAIYIVDRESRTIFETSLAGTFINSYRTFDETLFASLAGIAVDENRNLMYVLSGNSVLAFNKQDN
ncbi:MAG: hypothetical protein OXP68_06140 [Anaerolineaceae bacterium]|nr:hypothetical protein [Anaerolineaceae bacterium]MDE0327481.1 hypothetical protein [Anaerolineaceae bacterium]